MAEYVMVNGKRVYGDNKKGNSQSSQGQKKHTGAKTGITRNGDLSGSPYTQGWNYSKKHGLVKFLAVCTTKTKTTVSKTGRKWLNVMVKVQKPFSVDVLISGLMDEITGKVIIGDWNWVMNPKAPNGGYCGKIGKK